MSDTTQARSQRSARASAGAAEDNVAADTLRPEIPSSVVDVFDKGLARAKDAHEKLTAIMENSTGAFEEAFSCAQRGVGEYRVKLMEIGRANTNSAFDLARGALEAKSLPELFELVAAHQRKQFDLASAQMKELSALTHKVMSETADPIRSGMTEPFKLAS